MIKNENGVTIIALVVTIIILLILATISIYNFKGNDSTILNAVQKQGMETLKTEAKQEIEVEIEKVKLENNTSNINEFTEKLKEKLKDNDQNTTIKLKKDNPKLADDKYIVTYRGYTFTYFYEVK